MSSIRKTFPKDFMSHSSDEKKKGEGQKKSLARKRREFVVSHWDESIPTGAE